MKKKTRNVDLMYVKKDCKYINFKILHTFDQKPLSLCGGGAGGSIEKVTKGNKRSETVNRYFERRELVSMR